MDKLWKSVQNFRLAIPTDHGVTIIGQRHERDMEWTRRGGIPFRRSTGEARTKCVARVEAPMRRATDFRGRPRAGLAGLGAVGSGCRWLT
jgi:hypothetical protein